MKTKIVQFIKGLFCELVWLFYHNCITFGAIWLSVLLDPNWTGLGALAIFIVVPLTLLALFILTYFCFPSHKATLLGLPILAVGYLLSFSPLTSSLIMLHNYSFLRLYMADHFHWSVIAIIFTIISFALQNVIVLIRRRKKHK